MSLEMVFFDMGGTIDLYPKKDEYVAKACADMREMLIDAGASIVKDISQEDFKKLVVRGYRQYTGWRTEDYTELPPEKLFSEFIFKGTGIDESIINKTGEDLAFLIDTGFFKRAVRPEAERVIKLISSKGLRMGIISNVMSREQVPYSLKKYSLESYFEFLVLSSVFGKRKPHPDIFLHACRKAGVEPSNAMFIGNSPSKDIGGAKNAGMGYTVLIEYNETSANDTGPEADYSIKNLEELIPVIESIKSSELIETIPEWQDIFR